jgi:hypothetical protein
MGRTILIGLLALLSAATAQAQVSITDQTGNVTTVQGDTWSDLQGNFGYIQRPLDLRGGGFFQGLNSGLDQAHSNALSWGAFALQRDAVEADIRRLDTQTQIYQLEIQRLQQEAAWQQTSGLTPRDRFEAEVQRFYTEVLHDPEGAAGLITLSREGLLRKGRPANTGCPDRPTLLAIAVEGGSTNFQHLPVGAEAWLMDHQLRWGSTRGEAANAYMRSGYAVDCP